MDCHSKKEELQGLYGDDETGKLENCPFNCLKCKDDSSCEDCGNNVIHLLILRNGITINKFANNLVLKENL